uniref:Uncharacterized protein n=1 Tax=Cacopsylla melanoneura TaxID=428564 RepID=A0A8D9BUQ1_9HEMI
MILRTTTTGNSSIGGRTTCSSRSETIGSSISSRTTCSSSSGTIGSSGVVKGRQTRWHAGDARPVITEPTSRYIATDHVWSQRACFTTPRTLHTFYPSLFMFQPIETGRPFQNIIAQCFVLFGMF